MISRLEKLFFALWALFPFGMGAVYALINMIGGWSHFVKDRNYSFYLLNALIWLEFQL